MPVHPHDVAEQEAIYRHIELMLPTVLSRPDFYESHRLPENFVPFVWRDLRSFRAPK
jgi:hypothetical protein